MGPAICAAVFVGSVLLNELVVPSEWMRSHWAPFYVLFRFLFFPVLAIGLVTGGIALTIIGCSERQPRAVAAALCLAVVSGGYLLSIAWWPALTLVNPR